MSTLLHDYQTLRHAYEPAFIECPVLDPVAKLYTFTRPTTVGSSKSFIDQSALTNVSNVFTLVKKERKKLDVLMCKKKKTNK